MQNDESKIQIHPMQLGNMQEIIINNENTSYVSFNFTETLKLKITKIFKTILISINITCLILSLIFISIYHFELKNLTFLSSIFLLFTYFTTTYFIIGIKRDQSIHIQQNQHKSDHHRKHNQPNLIKSKIILTTFIVILGFSDTLFNLTQFLNHLFLIINHQFNFIKCGYSSIISILIERFVKIFYQLSILLFILQYENYYNAISKQLLYLKLFLVYLSLSFITQWCYIVLQEVYVDNGCISYNASVSNNLTSFETYEPILYPLAVEFRIYCFIEILYLYFCIKKIHSAICQQSRKSSVDQEIESDSEDEVILDVYESSDHQTLDLSNIPIMFGIFLMSCTIGFIFFQDANFESRNNNLVLITNELFEVLILFVCIILLIILLKRFLKMDNPRINFQNSLLLSLWPLHRFRDKKNPNQNCQYFKFLFSIWKNNDLVTIEAKIDLLTLNFSCLSLVLYSVLSIASLIEFINGSTSYTDNTKRVAKILALTTLLVLLVQVIVQIFVVGFMLYNQSYCRAMFRKLIQFLILLNFVLWLVDTFSAKKYFTNSTESRMWKIMGPLLIPLSILYRFQSCVILIKILYDKYNLNMLPTQYKVSLYRPMTESFSENIERY
jgi:hypothetical protein